VSDNSAENVIAFSGNTMVYESVKRFAMRGLNDLIRVLMESVDDALFELSEKVENDRDRNMYFEAMREIRRKRQGIMEAFDVELQQGFSRLIANRSSSKSGAAVDELSLVDQAEIEDRLAIDNMITKARPHFEDDLFAVAERLKVVLHRKKIPGDLNPLDPKAICDSFHNASAQLDTDIQVKLIFYKLFDKYVMSNLGHFYRELNDYFIQKGVLPEFKAEQERMKQTTKFMANRISRAQQQAAKENSAAGGQNITADAAQALEGGNLLSMLQQVLAPGGMAGSFEPSLYQQGAGSYDPSLFQQGAGSFDPALFQQGAGSFDPALFQQGGGTGEIPAVLPQNVAYISALSNLQAGNRVQQPAVQVDPQNMKQQLQQQLVTFREQNSEQGSSADNQIIDIVSMLFDFFFDDEALPDPVKVLIGRLQIPILKVAILDKGFFNHKKHPARKLLDTISKASLGWSEDAGQEKVLVDKLEQIVDYLLLEFDQDITVFEQALEDFQQFLQQENDRIEQAVQALKQQEKDREQALQQAQQVAGEFIQGLISRYELGFDVIEFLDGQWKSVLVQTWLAEGEDSNHWKNLKRITTTLIWSLIPKHSEQDKGKLLKTLPALLRALANGMDLIKIDSDAKNLVFQMLVQEHARVVKQTRKNIVTRVDDETVYPDQDIELAFSAAAEETTHDPVDIELGEDETGEIQMVDNEYEQDLTEDTVTDITVSPAREVIHNLEEFTQSVVAGNIFIEEEIVMDSAPSAEFENSYDEDDDEFLQQVQALELGAWVEFKESDSKSLNAKLSWKSNVTGKFVFVNRHGHKVRTMTRYGLATELRSGQAQLIEAVSVFDRAINSFMSSIRH
jgi:hypothetical protein